jgi:hypothetical protein
MLDAKHARKRMETMDLLAEAINVVTEQIGLFESVLRRYGGRGNVTRT